MQESAVPIDRAGVASGDSSNGATFSGLFSLDGLVAGEWTSESGGSSGTFEGAKNR
jgi:hypothetical protein